jgi:hypothetical protein
VTSIVRHVYRFLPQLRLAMIGPPGDVRHFDQEYAASLATGNDEADVVVRIGGPSALRGSGRDLRSMAAGGHKTVRWQVTFGDPSVRPIEADISLGGWPRSFALSLVQGYFVEGLVSLAAPGAGRVLLPAAALARSDSAVLLLGPSGAGKSSVAARMMASRRRVIGDDQVLVDGAGLCSPFPRRMRFYADLAETAPDAFRALAPFTRLRLRTRGLIDRLTKGYVRPSLAVDPRELASRHDPRSATIDRILIIEPRAPVGQLEQVSAETSDALAAAGRILELQRARLWSTAPPDWRAVISKTAELEQDILLAGFGGARIERLRIPAAWSAIQAVDALTDIVREDVPLSVPVPPRPRSRKSSEAAGDQW